MNAKQEFLKEFSREEVIAAKVSRYFMKGSVCNTENHNLYEGHTQEEMNSFLESIDFDYYEGYGTQEIYGTVWLTNGRWATRNEYEGKEWWEIHEKPEIHKRGEQ